MSPHNGEGHGRDRNGYDYPTDDEEEYTQHTENGAGFDRRSFLKFAGVATAGLAATGLSGTAGAVPTRDSFSFDRVVNAVEDLGMDPNGNTPIDDALDGALQSGTLVEFPPGTYFVQNTHSIAGMSNVGIRGTGENWRDVTFRSPQGRATGLLSTGGSGGRNVLVENLSVDNRNDDSTLVWFRLSCQGGVLVRDVEWLGRTPPDDDKGYNLTVEAFDRDGVNLVENVRTGLDASATTVEYPDGVQFVRGGPSHKGETVIRDAKIHNHNSAAMRYTQGGVVTVENSEFVNNQNANLRFTGGDHPDKHSSATGCYVKVDDSATDVGDAIRVDSSGQGQSGAVFRDIVIEWDDQSGRGVIAFPSWGDHGRAEFYNCVVRNDSPSATVNATSTSASDDAVVFENCSFTGDGGGFFADDRPGSVIRDSCIGIPDATIEGFETENVSDSACRTPSDVEGNGSGGDETSDETDGSAETDSTDETTDLPNELVVQGTGTATRYAFTVSEELAPVASTIESHDTVDGSTVEAWVTTSSHVDEFAFAGSITAFEYLEGGPAEITLNGESVAAEDLVDTNDGPTAEVTVTETDGLTAELSAEESSDPDGSIESYEWAVGDETYAGSTATHTFGDAGTYAVSLTVSDDDGASASATTDVSVSDESRLRIQGAGTPTQVFVEVSGELTAVEDTIEPWDEVGDASATVWVTDSEDVDEFTFTGELTTVEFDGGDADIFLDGSAVDPSSVGSTDETPKDLEIRGTGAPTQVAVAVDGELTAVEDTIEEWDEVGDTSATVWVTDGDDVDRFTFTGELTTLEFIEGEAAVAVDGTAVEPSEL
ncbi:PKD domain-containing protein [Halosimplex litoreum]|uniref:PKD domain-containing protein n=1 Tax=Halosimplex litoreum TaxID=1198301 RepID=A0A7T3KVF5_9EURY|nr:PKD domain-containing protein [Halosimplex litoreum]QPV63222.1 PKD domain-containing protein [Halosimplex litoreum]